MTDPAHGFDTLAVHAGQDPDPTTGSITPAIHQTSTYVQDGIGGLRNGYEYARAGNPTRVALEVQVAALERGAEAIAFASGLRDGFEAAVFAAGTTGSPEHEPVTPEVEQLLNTMALRIRFRLGLS